MTIKKQYLELIALLESNSDKKVKTILDEVMALCESKTMSKTHLRNKDGEVVAIFCYYHKQWELVSDVEYGDKKSSTTGLNTMCKKGVRGWTRTQKQMKDLDIKLLEQVMNEEIEASEIKEIKLAKIEAIKQAVANDEDVIETNFVTSTELDSMELD